MQWLQAVYVHSKSFHVTCTMGAFMRLNRQTDTMMNAYIHQRRDVAEKRTICGQPCFLLHK